MIETERCRKYEKEEETNRKTQKIRRAEQRRAERDKKRRVDKSRKTSRVQIDSCQINHTPHKISGKHRAALLETRWGGRCRSSDVWGVAQPFGGPGCLSVAQQWDPYDHVEEYLEMLVGFLKDCGFAAIWDSRDQCLINNMLPRVRSLCAASHTTSLVQVVSVREAQLLLSWRPSC